MVAMGKTIVLLIRQLYKISTDSIPVDSNDSNGSNNLGHILMLYCTTY